MAKKMLIDATHQEEMRVVVVDGTRIEEFDVETSTKKQLKGNIYLAKVIRVEPSLQAAFVDYGNERHGFLPFSEIHPDYYQIPIADREALKEALAENQKASARDEDEFVEKEMKSAELPAPEIEEHHTSSAPDAENEETATEATEETVAQASESPAEIMAENAQETPEIEAAAEEEKTEPEEESRKSGYFDLIRKYKIQEVIHRNQILLVQVTKEERGNKGAAITTYLSLAGRYCVLMPNNARGGGVSRKITNIADRHRLKEIVTALPVPTGMSVIVRTAGRERTKAEIKRDYDYLIKTWVQIRDMTMQSVAPCLIHEEGNLIKRSLRDLYTPDITEVLIEGEGEYKAARDFMKMLIPSHAKKVINYQENIPLFHRYQVEPQLEALHNPIVQLKSGGYLVINPTEALVAIDVNSGKATKERNIEDTALKTNLEAVDEVARQLRLRDLAGLVVVDLIDMEEPKNNYAVERRMKEALRRDRARVQMARISGFGLMEVSRQRLHSSFIETSYHICPYCQGKGVLRSTESIAVHLLRVIEEEGVRQRSSVITLTVPSNVALYVLNHKRDLLADIEKSYDVKIVINGDDSFLAPTDYRIERVKKAVRTPAPEKHLPVMEEAEPEPAEVEETETAEIRGEAEVIDAPEAMPERRRGRRGLYGRRRGRRFNRDKEHYERNEEAQNAEPAETNLSPEAEAENTAPADTGAEEKPRKGRFDRRRRHGRNNEAAPEKDLPVAAETVPEVSPVSADDETPKAKRRGRPPKTAPVSSEAVETPAPKKPEASKAVSTKAPAAVILFDSHAPKTAPAAPTPKAKEEAPAHTDTEGKPTKKRGGWWQKLLNN